MFSFSDQRSAQGPLTKGGISHLNSLRLLKLLYNKEKSFLFPLSFPFWEGEKESSVALLLVITTPPTPRRAKSPTRLETSEFKDLYNKMFAVLITVRLSTSKLWWGARNFLVEARHLLPVEFCRAVFNWPRWKKRAKNSSSSVCRKTTYQHQPESHNFSSLFFIPSTVGLFYVPSLPFLSLKKRRKE